MRLLLVNEWYNPVLQNLIHFFATTLGENFSWTGKRWYRKDFLPFTPEEQKSLLPEPEALTQLQNSEFSHVIFSDGSTLLYLSSKLKAKRILIDSLDYASVPRYYYENADFYFKAQYPKTPITVKNSGEKEGFEAEGAHRFSLTPSYKTLAVKNAHSFSQNTDVFFNGSAWPQDRIKLTSAVKAQKELKFSGGLYNREDLPFNNVFPKELFCPRLGLKDYLKQILGSKICLNFKGNGDNCFRQFEILHLGGFLLTQKTESHFCHVDTPGIVYFDGERDLVEKIRYYLGHDEERAQMALNGRKFFEEYLSPQKLTEYILEVVQNA
jgi:hypothetical protein